MSLKMKSIFAVRLRSARTAEFWDCKAFLGNMTLDTSPSFLLS